MIPYHVVFSQVSEWSGISTFVLAAICAVESGFDPNAYNEETMAAGIAQFIPSTWVEWGQGDVYNPEDAIPAMGSYLAYLREQTGSTWWAIVAYHYGVGNTLTFLDEREGKTFLELNLELPAEELTYVGNVLMHAKAIRDMLNQ